MIPTPNLVMTPQGERIAVLLPIDDYLDLIEDIEDLTAIIERQDEPLIDHETVMAELRADGLL